jgi:hypothetical protein
MARGWNDRTSIYLAGVQIEVGENIFFNTLGDYEHIKVLNSRAYSPGVIQLLW